MRFKTKARLLILPGLAGFLIFYIIPFFWSFLYAFTNNPLQLRFVGLANFIDSLRNRYYLLALRNTLNFTVIGVIVIVLFSISVSALLSTAGKRYGFLHIAFILPMLLPTGGVALIWRMLFNPDGAIGHIKPFLPSYLGSVLSPQILPVYFIFIWRYCGFNIILLVAAISGIQRDINEAAALDGAGGWKLYTRITLPLIHPTLFFIMVLSIVNSFRIYKEMYYLFDTNYPHESVYILQYYMNNHFQKLNYQMLSSGAIIFAAIVFLIVFFGYRADIKGGQL